MESSKCNCCRHNLQPWCFKNVLSIERWPSAKVGSKRLNPKLLAPANGWETLFRAIAWIICFLQRSPALTAERWWAEDSMEGRLPPTLTSHPTNLTNAATAATLLLMLLLEPIHWCCCCFFDAHLSPRHLTMLLLLCLVLRLCCCCCWKTYPLLDAAVSSSLLFLLFSVSGDNKNVFQLKGYFGRLCCNADQKFTHLAAFQMRERWLHFVKSRCSEAIILKRHLALQRS